MNEPIILRYFPVLGRAQALRHALADAELAFRDLRIPLEQWSQHKDSDAGGPYGSLPTLRWHGVEVAETIAIASFLARSLGHYEGRDNGEIARLEAVVSLCYTEVSLQIAQLLWLDLFNPGVDLAAAVPLQFGRLVARLTRLEAHAPEAGWFGGERPLMADYFAAEAIEALRYLLGREHDDALRTRLPHLCALARRMAQRPALAQAWSTRPQTFTAHPDEAAMLERLRALPLAATIGASMG